MSPIVPASLPSPPLNCSLPALSRNKDKRLPILLPPIQTPLFTMTPSPSPPLIDAISPPFHAVDRKGSIASLLNSDPELRQLDEEETRRGYQSHFVHGMLDSYHRYDPRPMPFAKHMSPSPAIVRPPSPLRPSMPLLISKSRRKRKSFASRKGLRHFSKQVCDKVAERGTTTYSQVADELAFEIHRHHPTGEDDQKNIRRRVYDALNVLMAMGIIAKDKKQIKWLGLPHYFKQPSSHGEQKEQDNTNTTLDSHIKSEEHLQADLVRSITQARRLTRDALKRHLRVQKLIWYNRQAPTPPLHDSVVRLPFYLVNCPTNDLKKKPRLIAQSEGDAGTAVMTCHTSACRGSVSHPVVADHNVLQHLPHLASFSSDQLNAWLPDRSWHQYLHEPCSS